MDVILTEGLVTWLLIFSRLGAMLMLVPLFGATNVPMQVKILFTGFLALIFYTSGQYEVGISLTRFDVITTGIIFEIVNGLSIGFVVVAIMNAVYIAGHIIDMDMGFAMVNVISAQDESEMPITANFYYLLIMIIFVTMNAHHRMIEAFIRSLQIAPLGILSFSGFTVSTYFELIKETFIIGFQMAMPVITTIMIANIILGMLAKAMPGMNVFMVGMPFKILIGIFTIYIVFPVTVKMMVHLLDRLMYYMEQVLLFMR
ncbi:MULTISPECIES: flagellar biosynthetic protein FliR [unclassified Fusibacter]|uniref:flagellar biosynthetic protein FliR n=1 Tax=unclassified Fusibacter TaxID=2624464 RepID=UPI0010132CFA|nr:MULTISPECIES: flagellar biosynthetic protein FliR [unclassified Fusibacter]MCK8058774.1 flagellar biosynthetic protein FliR [Fusibacter sp. A2]NPE21848.1 flagellar biosynthetic protein FliR [Fusibacter sp. A1]RXV61420.1 flagellar biosynthetic protein FliR [Fusibacter sp. A1]